MNTEWVIGYWKGDAAKNIIGLASEGVGYFILEEGRQGNQATVQAAYRRPTDSPRPENIIPITDFRKIEKLEERYRRRHGIDERPVVRPAVSDATIANIRDIFNNRRSKHHEAIRPTTTTHEG
jgi:hypothetical protein